MHENVQRKKIKEITEKLENGIRDMFQSEQFISWLKTMSKFHKYSLNNTLLIFFQKPDATLVAGYTKWKNDFGRNIKKGERAIKIFAPAPYKKMIETVRIDVNTHEPIIGKDGNPIKDTQEIVVPAFKIVNVFDVSQTEGRELPSFGVDELTGSVKDYDRIIRALKLSCPVTVDFEDIENGVKGYYRRSENRIAIQKDMSQVQTIKTMIHEMAHQRLHSGSSEDENVKKARSTKEVEAESVAYTICQHYGIETSDYSFAYIAKWSQGKGIDELKESLNTIRDAVNEMISEIDEHLIEKQMDFENTNEIEEEEIEFEI